jgi:transposase-like protein
MTKRHRRHGTARKRDVVEAYFNGVSMRGLSQKYDVCGTLIPIWVDKYERGEFDDDAKRNSCPSTRLESRRSSGWWGVRPSRSSF